MQAKPDESGPAPARSARYEAPQSDTRVSEDLNRALGGGATQQDAPVISRPTRKTPATSETEYTSWLLRAKRRARDDLNNDNQND